MPDSAIKGREIIFLWDSPKDENNNYIPYEQYMVIVKYGNPFISTDFEFQKKEAIVSVHGQVFEIDGHTIAEKGTGGYLTGLDKNEENISQYKTYKITFDAQVNGGYYFSLWSLRSMDGDRCGPVYYPGNTLGLTITTEVPNPQEPYIVSSVRSNFVSLDESVSIYGLTAEGVSTSNITSPSKSSGGGETKVILRGEHSPDFNYRAFIKSTPIGQTIFSAKSRITIRKVSPNNTPSRTIYYLFPLGDIAGYQTFEFPSEANSLNAVKSSARDIANIPTNTYVTTEHLTEEMIPLRDFDIVVEAYDPLTGFTSAGNKLYDGWDTMETTKVSEGDFKVAKDLGKTTVRREPYGYDILEVRLEPPSSLIMLNEYNDAISDNDITQAQAYDLKIPYLLEPKITNDGNLTVEFNVSEKNGKKYLNTVDIFNTYFQDIRGIVLYYADEPFVLANEQISIPEGKADTKQIFEVEKKPFSYDDQTRLMEVQRIFFLLKDLTIDPILGTVSRPLPEKMNAKKSNIVVGFFDTLLHQKHFDANDTARQLASRGNIKTIYGEKNLNFSRVAVPVDDFSGNERVGGTKKTFNPEKDLTLNSASIAIYRESLKDEDASTASFELEVREDGAVINFTSIKNMSVSATRTEPGKVPNTSAVNIQVNLPSEFIGIPVESYREEYIDPESKQTYYVSCVSGGLCTNRIVDLTNNKLSPLIQIKDYNTKSTPNIKNFKYKVEYSLIGG
jgi:hypothetical protein